VKNYIFVFLISIFLSNCTTAFNNNPFNKIEILLNNFNGEVGFYFLHLDKGIDFGINENKIFPSASLIKIPIMVQIFNRVENDNLNLDSLLFYDSSLINYKYKGDDSIARFKENETISINKLLTHMITFSDNHASLWLQIIAGGGTKINEILEKYNFTKTKVNSRTLNREDQYLQYGWGQTTPKEMSKLMIEIKNGNIVSKKSSDEMYRHLTRIYWDDEALSQIPNHIQVASKQGAVNKSRSEVVLVNSPSGDYVFCIITNNQSDESWSFENEGFVLIRKISRLLWNYYQ
tara:strand:+ start:3211 stop:4080 length:870 start_codon:yes stop_codon:yes gene_type:complete